MAQKLTLTQFEKISYTHKEQRELKTVAPSTKIYHGFPVNSDSTGTVAFNLR